jgi:hypothetical protein
MSFSVLLGALKKKTKRVKKIKSPYFVYFCGKRKCRNNKKYHVLIFLLKKKEREK